MVRVCIGENLYSLVFTMSWYVDLHQFMMKNIGNIDSIKSLISEMEVQNFLFSRVSFMILYSLWSPTSNMMPITLYFSEFESGKTIDLLSSKRDSLSQQNIKQIKQKRVTK